MARVEIRNATVIQKLGEKGFLASTSFETRAGDTITEYWTVWGYNDVSEGDKVDVDGLLSVRLDSWEDKETGEPKQAARAHVNNPQVRNQGQSQPMIPADPIDMEAPF